LTNSVQRQSRISVSAPPRIRPRAAPEAPITPKTENARLRSSGDRERRGQQAQGRRREQRGEGALQRASTDEDGEAGREAPDADAMANPARPVTKTRLRPNTSPRRPPSSSRLPNDSA
jgi:hypothetical protein